MAYLKCLAAGTSSASEEKITLWEGTGSATWGQEISLNDSLSNYEYVDFTVIYKAGATDEYTQRVRTSELVANYDDNTTDHISTTIMLYLSDLSEYYRYRQITYVDETTLKISSSKTPSGSTGAMFVLPIRIEGVKLC